MNFSIDKCSFIKFPKISDPRGNLSFIQEDHCEFNIKRVYYLFDIPFKASRGGHSHKNLFQIIIAISGSFVVLLDDGKQKKEIMVSDPTKGLLITPWIWRELKNFSSNAVCLVLASEKFDEDDYIRDYSEFKKLKIIHDS